MHARVDQVNRLAYMAVCLHCLLPTSWVPPLTPPTAADLLPGMLREPLSPDSNVITNDTRSASLLWALEA